MLQVFFCVISNMSGVNYSGTTVVASPDASGAIVLLDGTTEISSIAFSGNTNITSITFNTDGALKSIGNSAFQGCSGLTGNLTIPASVTTIWPSAFLGCSGLTAVRISGNGTSLTYLGSDLLASTPITHVSVDRGWVGFTTFGLDGVPIVPYSSIISFLDVSEGDPTVSSVVVSWDQPFGATSYDLQVAGAGDSQLISPATPGQFVSDLYYGTTYTFTLTIYYDPDTPVKTVTATYTTAPCFLADAPVLTPAGYRPIASLRVGDLVQTSLGKALPIVSVKKIRALPVPKSLPYLIPAGLYGATQDLPISPHHLVRQPGKEARHLGLAIHPMTEPWDYYNLELTNHAADMVVAGVVVETWKPWNGVERTS